MEAAILRVCYRVFFFGSLLPIWVRNLNLVVNPDPVCSFVSLRFLERAVFSRDVTLYHLLKLQQVLSSSILTTTAYCVIGFQVSGAQFLGPLDSWEVSITLQWSWVKMSPVPLRENSHSHNNSTSQLQSWKLRFVALLLKEQTERYQNYAGLASSRTHRCVCLLTG